MNFEEIYKQTHGNTLVSRDRFESIYLLCNIIKDLEGCAAEVGVYKGGTAFMISRTLDNTPCFFFDTFEGLPQENTQYDNHHKKGDFVSNELEVKKFLSASNVVVIKGVFPTTSDIIKDDLFKFVHLDVDLYDCTMDALNFFYPKMVQGGVIVTDDYEWKHTEGVTTAFNEFFANKPEKIIKSTNAQAYIIKS